MTTPEKITDILRDLYTLDPEFKKHEQKLTTIISQLLASKPEVTVDAAFADTLRRKLTAQITVMEHAEVRQKGSWSRRLNYALGSLALISLVATIVIYKNNGLPQSFNSAFSAVNKGTTITATTPEAFGSLANMSAGGKGGGGTAANSSEAAPIPQAAPKDTKIAAPGTFPAIVEYTYEYKGEKLKLTETELPVYKRSNNNYPEVQKSLLSRLNLKNFGFNNFTNPQMETLSFHDDRDFGYTATIDFTNGTLSLNQNWARWPNDYLVCNYNPECLQQHYRTTSLTEGEILDIANNFFKDQGISLSEYGSPEIQSDWGQIQKSLANDPSLVPPYVSVVYPRKIKGETVRDEGGNPSGVVVNISIWQKRVGGVYDYGSLRLEESKYQAETDFNRIIQAATSSSYTGPSEPNTEKVTVTLGTPTKGLIKSWLQKPNEPIGNEVYSPALLFPVLNGNTTQPYYSKYVVVPLIKEILDGQSQRPQINIMEKQ